MPRETAGAINGAKVEIYHSNTRSLGGSEYFENSDVIYRLLYGKENMRENISIPEGKSDERGTSQELQ